ncbi:MAG: helix-turn-helix domain-containing protein [Bdellovibrionota bacterium]
MARSAPNAAPKLESLGLARPVKIDGTAEEILEAAAKEFLEFGLRRTAMEDVARKAGVARVTIYRRFPTKDALVQAVFLREVRSFIAEVEAAIPRGANFEERLVEGFTAAVRLARANALITRLLSSDPDIVVHYLTAGAKPALDVTRAYLAHHIRAAHKGRNGADAAAESVMRLGLSFLLTRDSCIKLDDEKSVREYAKGCILPLATGRAAVN